MIKNNRFRAFATLLAMVILLSTLLIPKSANATSSAYAVVDARTGIVLAERCGDVKKPMASTTKVMTAITVIECIGNLDEKFFVPKAAVGTEGSSVYLKEGEEVSIRELLYCLMLRSGNDAAVALSIIVGGSEKNFVQKMNEKAALIGANNTHFENPHGLHKEGHYTTAKDLAKISAYAMKNKTFAEIVSTKVYKGERGTYLNKNKLLSTMDGANGIKTGYTKAAGRCLVSSATRDGNTLVCVVLDCPPMYETSKSLMEECFEKYRFLTVWKESDEKNIPINGIPRLCARTATDGDVVVPVKKGEEDKIKVDVKLKKNLDFPVKKGQKVGRVDVFYQNSLLFSQKIFTIENVGTDKLIFFVKKEDL